MVNSPEQFRGAISAPRARAYRARLYPPGGKVPCRSPLADANRDRSYAAFSGLFADRPGMAAQGLPRKIGEAVRLIDSTSLQLSGRGAQGARFSTDVCGAKAHIVYDCPVYPAVTAANINDVTAAKERPLEAGATDVFDLGYYDDAWWAKLDAADCCIVTRWKSNTPLIDARGGKLDAGGNVLYGRLGFLPARQAKSRKNPMPVAVREIGVMTERARKLRVLTNDLAAPAQEIADLDKRRWQIELLFRFVKQTLKIKRFLGRSENAVRLQLAVAPSAFLLLPRVPAMTKGAHRAGALVRLLRINLIHRQDMTRRREIPSLPARDSRRLTFDLAST